MLLPNPVDVAKNLDQSVKDFSFAAGPIKSVDTALSLVIQDTQRAEKFIMARLWMSEWRVAKSLYEAPVKVEYWRDTLVPRASNPFPLSAQHVRAILDASMPALFPANPPFDIEPNPGVPRQVARAWEPIIGYQLRRIGFKGQVRLVAKDALVFGTGIGKWGWEEYTRKVTRYVRAVPPQEIPSPVKGGRPTVVHTEESDKLDAIDGDEQVSRPFFCRVEINHILVSPGLREPNIQKAQYVVHRMYPTIRDLNRLRDFEGYEIPSEEELKRLVEQPAEQAPSSAVENEATAYPAQGHRPTPRYIDESADPLEHKLELLEHWTEDRVVAVLQRKVVIRNEANPFGVIPFVSCYWDDIPGTFYAFGVPRRIGSVQTHIQGLRNLRLDDINLNLQNVWLEVRGSNIGAQPFKIYPGCRLKVDNADGLKPLIKQPVLGEAWREEMVLVADAEKTTGANEQLVQGAMPAQGRSSLGRTATGAGIMGSASSARVQSFVNVVADQVMLPVFYAFMHMDRERLDPSTMRKILGKTLYEDLESNHEGDLLVDMCNTADIEFTMLAGTDIGAKRAMAQMLPLQMQLLMQPAVQQGLSDSGYKPNWLEFARRAEEVSGWKSQEDLFIPITPQDMQRRMMMNPEMIKGKLTQARLAQLHQNNMQLKQLENQGKIQQIDAKGLAGAGEEIITRAIERAAQKDEMAELAGGFGGEGQ